MLNQPAPKNNSFLYIFFMFLAIASFSLGFLGAKVIKQSFQPIKTVNLTTPPNTLSADLIKLLENPLFSNWQGSVNGKVSEKTPYTMTLENNGQKLIFYIDDRSKFEGADTPVIPESSSSAFLPYDQIAIGTELRGNVEFVKDDNGNLLGIWGRRLTVQK